jgi:glycosyltransferase involved in cell wall biosynthesis
MTRILLVSNDRVGSSMAGPAIRYWELARELAKQFEVTLAVPVTTDLTPDGFEIVATRPRDSRHLTELALGANAVVAQELPLRTMARLARSPVRAIYDLYTPIRIELLALYRRKQLTQRELRNARHSSLAERAALATGNGFICASEKQRDLWLGALGQAGRLDSQRYRADPSFRGLIDVVPFGLDPASPRAQPVLKGVLPGIGSDDRVLLWAGGIWNWFDPLTVIRAVAELDRKRTDVRLVFLGTRHPNPEIAEMTMTRDAVTLAEELGLRDRVVFFNEGWVPYDERGAYLLEADLGVSAHFDDIETRFAFRTRILDYFWAALPVVTTRGDALSDLVGARGLGRTVDFGDVDGWVRAIETLLDDGDAYRAAKLAIEDARREYEWPGVTERLIRMLDGPSASGGPRARIGRLVAEDIVLRGRMSLEYRGVPNALLKQLRRGRPLAWRA